MPFAFLETPSIGLSLLRAGLERSQVSASVHYATLDFGRRVGPAVYDAIAVRPGMSFLAGEWLFTEALCGEDAVDEEAYSQAILNGSLGPASRHDLDAFLRQLHAARKHVPAFLEHWRNTLLETKPTIVGFTSVFQQHIASLALARLLKEADPELTTVLGGPNCDDAMGVQTAREFDCIDAVVYGEADELFPILVDRIVTRAPIDDLDGVYTTTNAAALNAAPGAWPSTLPVENLDGIAPARYDDFIDQMHRVGLSSELRPELLLETSRGCWWGEKHHCVFCGLNDVTMGYRHKSARRVLEELRYLRRLAPTARITGTDAIFNMRYFADLIPMMAAEKAPPQEMYFETKANLRDRHIQGFYAAGIRAIQPGIESFLTPVLKRMDKGVTAAQNVRLLRACEEFGVAVFWNHLWGIPGEDPADYAELARQISKLTHLQPPEWMGEIAVLRFSPLQIAPENFGITKLVAARVYDYIYPRLDDEAKDQLAYYFDAEYVQRGDVAAYTQPVAEEISMWRDAHAGSILFWEYADDAIALWDTRPVSTQPHTLLQDAEREAFLRLREPMTAAELRRQMRDSYDENEVTQAVSHLDDLRVLFVDVDRLLNVSVEANNLPVESATPQIEFARREKLRLKEKIAEIVSEPSTPSALARFR